MQQVWMEEPVETDVLLADVQPKDAQPGAGFTGTDAKDEKANVPNPGEPEEGGVSTADRTEETDVSGADETKVQLAQADEHLRMLEERLSSLTLALKASEEARRSETEARRSETEARKAAETRCSEMETRCSEMETLLSGLNARLTEAEGARAAAEETLARTKGQLSETRAQLSEAQAQLAREGVRTQLMLALTDAGCLDREYLCDKLLAAAGRDGETPGEIPGEISLVSQLVEQGQKAHPALFFRPEVTGLPAAEGRALPGESPGTSRWDARSLTALNLSQRARLFAEDPAGYALLRSR